MLDNLQLLLLAPFINLQVILDGIFIGAVFALGAYGLALVWGVMNVKNLAQGDFVIMGGYIAYAIFTPLHQAGFPAWLIIPIMLIVSMSLMFVFGYIVYILIIRRVIGQDLFTTLLATFGLSLLLQQVMNLIFGPEVQTIDSGLPIISAFGNSVTIPMVKVVSLVLATALAVTVVIFMRVSRTGQAIRATAQDPRAARVLGIDTDRIFALTFSLNAMICGAAGVLVAMIWVLQPFYGIIYSIRSFAIVTAAGLGNLPAVIGTGFGLGLIEQYVGIIMGAEYQVAAAVVMLLLVLIWRQIQVRRQRQVVR
jgi:branched-chain amino acid transport system permease protein